VPNYPTAIHVIGAPKLFYDAPSKQYLVTWHTPHEHDRTELPERYRVSQRTLYATSQDLR
jgi:hypothetical protein